MGVEEVRLGEMAGRLVAVPGVVGVVLGGSRARDEHVPESDVDLGRYYRPPLDVDALGRLARSVAGDDTSVTQPGAWGPWVDGGGWLTVAGTAVDWLYRDVDRVHAAWTGARAGRYRFHVQVGHPLGVLDVAYAGELAVGRILADPTRELSDLARDVRAYPPALGEALVAGLFEASFLVDVARKAVSRGDTTYVAGCLFRAVGVCAHALHGRAGRWLVNEKIAVEAAGRLPRAPDGFAARGHGLLAHPGRTPGELAAALDDAAALVRDVEAACRP